MRLPFERPFFAWIFYIVAGLFGLVAFLMIVALVIGNFGMFGQTLGVLLATYGVIMVAITAAQALAIAAAGYVIETVAKIEWNTRREGYPL